MLLDERNRNELCFDREDTLAWNSLQEFLKEGLELSEIEQTIRCIEYIDDVTVQTIKNGSNNELIAYVVAPDFEGDIIEYNGVELNLPDLVKEYLGIEYHSTSKNIVSKDSDLESTTLTSNNQTIEYRKLRNSLVHGRWHTKDDKIYFYFIRKTT